MTPLLVTCWNFGVMGREIATNHFKEVVDQVIEDDVDEDMSINFGMFLFVGSLPGMEVEAIPLFRRSQDPLQRSAIGDFVREIRAFTASASSLACNSPAVLIMFGRQNAEMDAVMQQIDSGMPEETIVVGDGDIEFMYRSKLESRNFSQNEEYSVDAVALVFARKGEARGVEEIQIHAVLSSGVSAIVPDHIFQVVGASEMHQTTVILASQGGHGELNWKESLRPINEYVARNRIRLEDLFIEVQKHRKLMRTSKSIGVWSGSNGISEGVANPEQLRIRRKGGDSEKRTWIRRIHGAPEEPGFGGLFRMRMIRRRKKEAPSEEPFRSDIGTSSGCTIGSPSGTYSGCTIRSAIGSPSGTPSGCAILNPSGTSSGASSASGAKPPPEELLAPSPEALLAPHLFSAPSPETLLAPPPLPTPTHDPLMAPPLQASSANS